MKSAMDYRSLVRGIMVTVRDFLNVGPATNGPSYDVVCDRVRVPCLAKSPFMKDYIRLLRFARVDNSKATKVNILGDGGVGLCLVHFFLEFHYFFVNFWLFFSSLFLDFYDLKERGMFDFRGERGH